MDKTLFNEMFSLITEALDLEDSDIVGESDSWISKDGVRSWRNRGVPAKKNILLLSEHVAEAAEAKNSSFGSDYAGLNKKIKEICDKYGVSARELALVPTDTLEETVRRLITVSVEKSKDMSESKQSVRRVVAFDLDGTLIKGIRHSWNVLWEAIGRDNELATEHKKEFEECRLSYKTWCKMDRDALRDGGLTMQKVAEAVAKNGCSLTKNLIEAVDLLHENNCKVVIISGGADCLLTTLLPNAAEIFDDIYINRCIFGRDGVLEDIIPTEYDWDDDCVGVKGKDAGFNFLCAKHGAELKDSVFVGDDRNDFRAMELAGMKIFYHSFSENDVSRGITRGAVVRDWPRDIILESRNDLMCVARRILDWHFGD